MAAAQKSYGVCREASPLVMNAAACPNCGAGRAKQDMERKNEAIIRLP